MTKNNLGLSRYDKRMSAQVFVEGILSDLSEDVNPALRSRYFQFEAVLDSKSLNA